MSAPYQEQIDQMTWSFSRLNSFYHCNYGWKLQYLDKVSQCGSGFAEWGSLCHSIFEDYAKGNLADFELLDAYEERYPQYMENEFPPSRGIPMAEKYYERGRELFAAFPGFPENWEILAVEQEVRFEYEGVNFLGYIDLLVRDKTDGRLIVVDHKSKAAFKNEDEQSHYAIQLYLYAYWVWQTYHEYPKELLFNMFRVDQTVTIPFEKSDMDAALKWVTDTVEAIRREDAFESKPLKLLAERAEAERQNDFAAVRQLDREIRSAKWFCDFLCSSRMHCSDWEKGQ